VADENLEDALFDESFVAPDGEAAAADTTGKQAAPSPKGGEGDAGEGGEAPAGGEGKDDKAPKDPKAAGEGGEGDADGDGKGATVPKAALDAARKKAREAEKRLERLEAAEAARQAEAAKADIPDPIKEPVKHAQYLQRQQTAALINERLNTSETLAREKHGDEKVDAMMEWAKERFDADVDFAKSIFSQPHPYGAAMKAYEDAQAASTPGDHGDPEYAAFLAWKASQTDGQNPNPKPAGGSTPAPAQPAAKPPLPKSIAAAPSAGGPHGETVVKDPFDSEFG